MKISRNNKLTKKTAALIAISLLLISAVIVASLEKTQVIDIFKSPTNGIPGPTEADKKAADKAAQNEKEEFINSPDPTVVAPEDRPTARIELSAKQESNGSVTVLSKLFGIASGTCNLSISNGSRTYSTTASVIYQPEFSSCAGFSIEKDKLGAGMWLIKLSLANDATPEKALTLEVK